MTTYLWRGQNRYLSCRKEGFRLFFFWGHGLPTDGRLATCTLQSSICDSYRSSTVFYSGNLIPWYEEHLRYLHDKEDLAHSFHVSLSVINCCVLEITRNWSGIHARKTYLRFIREKSSLPGR